MIKNQEKLLYKIIKRLFLFHFLILSLHIRSQSNQELFSIPDSLKNDSYETLMNKLNKERINENATLVSHYAQTYLNKAKNENDTIKIANGYSQFVSIISYKDIETTFQYTDSILNLTKDLNHADYPGYAYMVNGMLYEYINDHQKSIENYNRANKLAKKYNNTTHRIYISSSIADIKNSLGKVKEELALRKVVFDMLDKPNSESDFDQSDFYFDSLLKLTTSYIANKKLDSAQLYNNMALKESLHGALDYYNFFVATDGEISYFKKRI